MTLAGFSYLLHFTRVAATFADPLSGAIRRARAYLFTLAASRFGDHGCSCWCAMSIPIGRPRCAYALFNTVSVATTTGFSNTNFDLWPIFAPVLMLFVSGSQPALVRPAVASR